MTLRPSQRISGRARRTALIVMLLASLCAPAGARAADLPLAAFQVKAPDASYFDVDERMRRPVRPATLSSADSSRIGPACAPPARIDPIDYYVVMPSFYDDRAGWDRANEPFLAFENGVTSLAADYVRTGNPCHAHALAGLLRDWAERGALLKFDYRGNSKQAWYAIAWAAASSGMAYSVVRAEPSLDEQDKRVIEAWLARVARKQISYKGGPTSCCNNHFYWRGLQAAIVGVVAQDDALFQYGVRAYRSALSGMNDDGSFRLEMTRGRRALHYQNFALLPLIYIAEIASRQGYDLYGATVDGDSIHDAVGFLLNALEDPTLVRRYTDAEQDLGFVRKGTELNWLEPYQRRFPTPRIARLLAQVRPVAHRWSGGPSTLYFKASSEPQS